MMELEFVMFWEHYEKQNKIKNQDRRTLHFLETADSFILYLKSNEYWEYFAVIKITDIMAFGRMYDVTREKAILDFKINFLSRAMPIKSFKKINKSLKLVTKEIKPFDDEDAKDYLDFLEKEFNKWKRAVMDFIDETLSDEVFEKGFDTIDKTFGEFMSRLFNVVNTSDFRAKVTTVIRRVFKDGVEDAEAELNIDIGFDQSFNRDVEQETNRQIDGFMIDGKMWAGLKGVATDLQREIREEVVSGIESKSSMKEIKANVKDIFVKNNGGTRIDGSVTDGRVMKIARTESNRYRNAAKNKAYMNSGLVGQKKWNAFLDHRTSPICNRMDGQIVSLDKNFVDPKTGAEFAHPPSHPNCRSVLEFVLK